MFSTHLLRFVSETLSLCGDHKEHGDVKEDDNINTQYNEIFYFKEYIYL